MTPVLTTRTMLITLAALALACGKGPDDPLTGSWSNMSCFGDTQQPEDIQSCTTRLRFDADLTVTVTDTRQSAPATANYPRCTATRLVKGLRYSTNSQGTLTFTGSTTSTLERRDCANPADNQSEIADTRDAIAAGMSLYSIADRTLSLTSGPLLGEYRRE